MYPLSGFTPAAPKSNKPRQTSDPINWDEVQTDTYEELPRELHEKFEHLRRERPAIDRLWGGAPTPTQTDVSPSGFEFALSCELKRTGEFTSTNYAQLRAVWEHRSEKSDGSQRLVQRAWDNAPGPIASGFDVHEIPPLTQLQQLQQQGRQRKAQIERETQQARETQPEESNAAPVAANYTITATPFVWRNPKTIPRRQFLYGTHYIRQFVSSTIAPGGVGKSSLVLIEALAMATGRPLLGVRPEKRLRVWYWNGEDPKIEIERRVAAACIHYRIEPAELDDWLFIDSGRDARIVIAESTRDGAKTTRPVVEAVIAAIRKNLIDVMSVDPFVSSHHVAENDNNGMDSVVKEWSGIADATNSAIELVHHSRKTNGAEVTVEDARGASAVVSATRSARVINTMTKQEAVNAGVANNRVHFRCENGKANLAPPPDAADWFELKSIPLHNGDSALIDNGDRVAVVVPWKYPDMLAGVTGDLAAAALTKIRAGKYRENSQAKEWVGKPIAGVLGLNLNNAHEKARVRHVIKTWLANGALVVVDRRDKNGEMRPSDQCADQARSGSTRELPGLGEPWRQGHVFPPERADANLAKQT